MAEHLYRSHYGIPSPVASNPGLSEVGIGHVKACGGMGPAVIASQSSAATWSCEQSMASPRDRSGAAGRNNLCVTIIEHGLNVITLRIIVLSQHLVKFTIGYALQFSRSGKVYFMLHSCVGFFKRFQAFGV